MHPLFCMNCAAGVPVAVCSTSNERAVSTIVRVMLGDKVASIMRVFAGDVVPKKKPDPAIYLLAAKELGVNPARYICMMHSSLCTIVETHIHDALCWRCSTNDTAGTSNLPACCKGTERQPCKVIVIARLGACCCYVLFYYLCTLPW
jgi:hypothetical protein